MPSQLCFFPIHFLFFSGFSTSKITGVYYIILVLRLFIKGLKTLNWPDLKMASNKYQTRVLASSMSRCQVRDLERDETTSWTIIFNHTYIWRYKSSAVAYASSTESFVAPPHPSEYNTGRENGGQKSRFPTSACAKQYIFFNQHEFGPLLIQYVLAVLMKRLFPVKKQKTRKQKQKQDPCTWLEDDSELILLVYKTTFRQ